MIFTDGTNIYDSTKQAKFVSSTGEGTSYVATGVSLGMAGGNGGVFKTDVDDGYFDVYGINMTIQSQDWNVFQQERKNGNFDFCREGWLADFNDPINMLEMWITDSGNNDCQYGRVG